MLEKNLYQISSITTNKNIQNFLKSKNNFSKILILPESIEDFAIEKELYEKIRKDFTKHNFTTYTFSYYEEFPYFIKEQIKKQTKNYPLSLNSYKTIFEEKEKLKIITYEHKPKDKLFLELGIKYKLKIDDEEFLLLESKDGKLLDQQKRLLIELNCKDQFFILDLIEEYFACPTIKNKQVNFFKNNKDTIFDLAEEYFYYEKLFLEKKENINFLKIYILLDQKYKELKKQLFMNAYLKNLNFQNGKKEDEKIKNDIKKYLNEISSYFVKFIISLKGEKNE